MIDKVQKIREELARLKEETSIGLSEHENGVEQGRLEVINTLSKYLDSLQKEPVSEDLEEVAHQYYKPNETFMDGFKKGVNWQKEQMMKDTIIAHVFGRETEKSLFCFKVDGDDYLIGHEVKVVILKDN